MMSRMLRLAALLSIAALPAVAAGTCRDLSLVLAIDASSSIDPAEYRLQTDGYAAALVAPRVLRALAQAGDVEIAVVFWGGAGQHQALPFQPVRNRTEAEALGVRLWASPRRVSGATALGEGVALALQMLAPRCAARRVVNVSGDGRESADGTIAPLRMAQARALAEEMNVSINGLAIETTDLGLGDYYRAEVVTGPGAFALTVRSFDALAAALVRKLEREVRPPLVSLRDPAAGSASGS